MAIGSNVNPNFPIPGIDNSSKGFRDNFSAIKAEIEALQTKRIVLTGDITGEGQMDGGSGDVIIDASVIAIAAGADGDDRTIQFNQNGALSGDTNLLWDYYHETLIVGAGFVPNYYYWMDAGGSRIHDLLMVEGTSDTATFTISTSAPNYPAITFTSEDTLARLNISDASPLMVTANGTDAVVITPSGVSINTGMGPTTALDIVSPPQSNIAVFSTDYDFSDNAVRFHTSAANSTIGLVLQQTSADMVGGIRIGTDGSLSLHVNGNNEGWLDDSTRAVIIDPAGQVSFGSDTIRNGDRLTLNTGNLNILELGYGIVFPDGTYQDTSAIPSLDFLSHGDPGTIQLADVAHQFQGDFNTLHYDLVGQFIGATPSLSFGSNGTKQMMLDEFGNLGIGTFDPYSYGKLAVQGGFADDSNSSAAFLTPGNADGELADLALYGSMVGGPDSFPKRAADIIAGYDGGIWGTEYLGFNVGGSTDSNTLTTEVARFTAGGNLAVGTQMPEQRVHVEAFADVYGLLRTTLPGAALGIKLENTDSQWELSLTAGNFNVIDSTNGLPVVRLSIDDMGKAVFADDLQVQGLVSFDQIVGIGTAAPNSELEVVGTIRATNPADANDYGSIYSLSGLNITSENNNPLYITTGGSTSITVDAMGNVSIGTASADYRLVINDVNARQNFRVDESTSGYTLTQGLDDTGIYWNTDSAIRGYRWINDSSMELLRIDPDATVYANNEIIISTDNGHGGVGYAGILTMTNSAMGATNPNKYVRLNLSGDLEIVDSAYANTILSLSDVGDLTVKGNIIGSSGNVSVIADDGVTPKSFSFNTDGSLSLPQLASGMIGNGSLDATNNIYNMAIGNIVDFAAFSGVIVVNCHASGDTSIWLCGSGVSPITLGSSSGSASGSMAYNPGIDGYTFTASENGNHVFFALRTRTGA